MVKRSLFMGLSLVAAPLLACDADNQNQMAAPKPYDYDLFSKDRECEYIEVEGLFLKFLQNQPIVSRSDLPNLQTDTTDSGVSERAVNVHYDWKPGFRLTLGYFNAPKYWEVLGQYTWFQDFGSKTVHSPGSSTQHYLRLWGYNPVDSSYNGGGAALEEVTAKAHFYYNDASALVSRNFYPNPHLRLRVLGGLTGVWNHASTHVENTFFGQDLTLNYRFHTKYWGVGFKMGTGADWYWGKDFYLTGRVFWSIVTGRWNTNTKVSMSDGTLLYQPHEDAYLAAQNFQFIFGPSYQKSYEKVRWELFLGYEFNSWLGLMNTYNYQHPTDNNSWSNPQLAFSNILLSGINLRLTLDF